MKGLFIFIGESFRLGNQGTRKRGVPESYEEQINASESHIKFIEHISKKYNLKSASVGVATYNTCYNDDLIFIYKKYLLESSKLFYDELLGLTKLFKNAINSVNAIETYDFIFYIRIDIYLKPHFFDVFNPTINMILFPSICWKKDCRIVRNPKVNDMMLFIPKKYFKYLSFINIGHKLWQRLSVDAKLTNEDLDMMINTYHDSDSFKDFNPIYYIVNRPQSNIHHSPGHIFDKSNFKN